MPVSLFWKHHAPQRRVSCRPYTSGITWECSKHIILFLCFCRLQSTLLRLGPAFGPGEVVGTRSTGLSLHLGSQSLSIPLRLSERVCLASEKGASFNVRAEDWNSFLIFLSLLPCMRCLPHATHWAPCFIGSMMLNPESPFEEAGMSTLLLLGDKDEV